MTKTFSRKIEKDLALTYDDILLEPAYSEVVPTEANTETLFSKNIKLKIPLVSSAMDTVTEGRLALEMARLGGIGVIHKNFPIAKQADEVKMVKDKGHFAAAAVGATGDFLDRAQALAKAGADALVVDTAHGHSKRVIEAVKVLKKKYIGIEIIAGNVATKEGALALIKAGADAVKVGMGPGSICTTRVVTGCGMPQVKAISNCAPVCKKYKVPLIADGGVKLSGDAAKAIALGADSVMLGGFFAGTDESPGEVFEEDGRKFKSYRGMGSLGAMEAGSRDRYGQEAQTDSGKLVPEGIEGRVVYKGSLKSVVFQLVGGIQAAMGYTGCHTISEFQKKPRFVQISSAGQEENHPHDIEIVKKAPNY